jgi:hypothetical protein
MKTKILPLFLFLAALPVFAQTQPAPSPVNTFALALSPISLPGNKQTVVGTASGATFTPTANFDVREDNLLASGFQFFGGGFNYRLPVLQTKLNNASPNLNGFRFQFYLTGTVGVDRITVGQTAQHYAFLAGGGVNYDLTGSGTWTLGGEVRYAKFPGLNNNTVVVALGPAIHF